MKKSNLNSACSEMQRFQFPRRKAIQAGAGMLGVGLPQVLKAKDHQTKKIAPTAKSIIFLYQFGGPTHIDTFDMKPNAAEGIRGPYQEISTNVPGLKICEHLPQVAKIMDKVTVIRSMTHKMKNHNSASYYALTGHAPPVDDIRLRDSLDLFPAYGSVVDHLTEQKPGIPSFVAYPYVIRDGAITPGQHASFLGKGHDPFLVKEDPNDPNFKLPELSLPANLSADRLQHRREILKLIDQQSELLEFSATAKGIDQYYDRALSMLNSDKVKKAFDLSSEPEKLREQYGKHTYGQSLILARRLVEAGVRFVNVYFSPNIGGQSKTDGGWDTHGFNDTRMFPIVEARHFPITDQTLPVFLNDLEERGLLDETLVVWMGEFGRTPKINKNKSRDHWPQCYTTILAGGGIKRGYIHGASDKNAAYPARDPVTPDDLAATMFHALGIDPETEIYDILRRPFPIAAGKAVTELFG